MHELSLAQSVVSLLLQEARRHDIGSIQQVCLRVGALRAVVPELLQTGLELVSRGTPAEGARFLVEQVPGQARCARCRATYAVEDLLLVCPACGALGGEILAGQELQLLEFDGE